MGMSGGNTRGRAAPTLQVNGVAPQRITAMSAEDLAQFDASPPG